MRSNDPSNAIGCTSACVAVRGVVCVVVRGAVCGAVCVAVCVRLENETE